MDELLHGLRAAAEPTRLRILILCAHAELTVSELVRILGQSQPRVSRHLRLLVDAGLLARHQEGNWAYYRQAERTECAELGRLIIDLVPVDDPMQALDLKRLEEVRTERAAQADEYFRENATRWDEIRAYYIDNKQVEEALRSILLKQSVRELLDIGTGTGGILKLVGGEVASAVGVDRSREMLAVARTSLDRAGLRNCHVRQSDMYQLPFSDERFDAVTLHMVLHYAEDPERLLAEAKRVLEPNGRLIIVDFAGHDRTDLAERQAHRWLGFKDVEIDTWFTDLGLEAAEPVRLDGDPLTVCLWSARRSEQPIANGLRVVGGEEAAS